MRTRTVVLALSALSAAVLACTLLVPALPAAAAADNPERGPNYSKRVVLSFDDCPRTLTAFKDVIKYAGKKNIGLVIAPTGRCIRKYQDRYGVNIAQYARNHGQYVINHTITHPDLRKLSCAAVAKEVSRWPGAGSNYGRPPWGYVNAKVRCGYDRAGLKIWLWDVNTLDYKGKTRAQVVSYAAGHARAGSTVLMHMDEKAFTPTAISQIRTRLADRGLKVCRAYRGTDNQGKILATGQKLPPRLPC
ncbi:polysaccharide deacetylase family protein [Arthrobacter sp. GCM10027362]|uniref:polysaccharide deacetylase family protein n=1 Tax=Arthrobacter sp. GCM10027362 TaxID=3273379 RepID=UPI003637D2C1